MAKILVVDDEKLIVKGISFSLQADGMEVDAAYDGEEALGKIREKNYDMVLLDVMLPKMSGMDVCQAVREFSDVPITRTATWTIRCNINENTPAGSLAVSRKV